MDMAGCCACCVPPIGVWDDCCCCAARSAVNTGCNKFFIAFLSFSQKIWCLFIALMILLNNLFQVCLDRKNSLSGTGGTIIQLYMQLLSNYSAFSNLSFNPQNRKSAMRDELFFGFGGL